MAAMLLMAGLSAACGDDDAGEGSTDTTDAAATETTLATTTTTEDPKAEVEAAYLTYWEMVERLVQDPNPDDPEIPLRVTGSARQKLVDSLETLRAQGQLVKPGAQTSHDVLSVDVGSGEATLRDCNVDDASRVLSATGKEIESAVTTNLLEVTLANEAGRWVVASIAKLDGWGGRRLCE